MGLWWVEDLVPCSQKETQSKILKLWVIESNDLTKKISLSSQSIIRGSSWSKTRCDLHIKNQIVVLANNLVTVVA